ncbi:hypothetical protein NDU88_003941 [Pleurodeles waltl]|uniref:Uncharacterized protein n=1 Tax=Pleurodeles waltl TaxID=8319 RepID=A0AAV7W6U2_PLEWA|nr:hypothetical protein NDU88_003941 [Pleurodeles waltl]
MQVVFRPGKRGDDYLDSGALIREVGRETSEREKTWNRFEFGGVCGIESGPDILAIHLGENGLVRERDLVPQKAMKADKEFVRWNTSYVDRDDSQKRADQQPFTGQEGS